MRDESTQGRGAHGGPAGRVAAWWLAAAAVLPAPLAGCGGGDDASSAASGSAPAPLRPALRFTDVTAASGLDFTTTAGSAVPAQIVDVKGGGIAVIDYDGDGDLDVFIPNGATMEDPEHGPGCRLYENRGDLTFADVTASAGLTFRRWGVGVAVGDYDADGRDDLYVTCYGRNALLRNGSDGRFEEVTEVAGVGDERWSTGAAFADLDGDGDLDLYVVNYLRFEIDHPPPPSTFKGVPVFAGPQGLPPQADALFENLGDGTFRDVTASSGCLASGAAYGLGVAILDFDGDGRQDIFVGNDSMPNFLFINDGGLRFHDVGVESGIASNGDGSNQATMGIAIADVDGNGRPDVFSTNFSSDTNTLQLNAEGGFFDDATGRFGLGMVSYPFLGWACGFYDFDQDADEDLLIFNGHVYPMATAETMDSDYLQTPLLFAREEARFERVEAEEAGPWLAERHCDRSAAFGDLDGDGDVDVVVSERGGRVRVLRNDGAAGGWLIVEAPVGSLVEVTAGGTTLRRWIFGGGGFVSASARYAHFGLPAGARTAAVRVVLPDGREERREGVAANRRMSVGSESVSQKSATRIPSMKTGVRD